MSTTPFSVDGNIKSVIESLNVPYGREGYEGKAKQFITYRIISCADVFFSDDENAAAEYLYRADLFSKTNFISLLRRLKAALKAAGAYSVIINNEIYETDTGYYHIPVEFKITEV